ncbi:DgyrCDS11429 [Dimorphilus gyrociliatus]|uniref:Box C/D snoRNA protein 1 n=1 Tax=Dimorphilus gyrociliatus TaxID=2664684 RepID=A0A7I8W4C6_9ANNE|nr:DgyrCDS11429 [Dimorphilus gyrociliatus]
MSDNERHKKCEVCNEKQSKYTCPKCSVRTCSLECVKQHKKAVDCDGKRDKTAYLSLDKFNDNVLYSDYYFLEDVNRAVENSERGPRHSNRLKLPEKRERLCKNAKKIGVTLEFLPKGMAKNRRNKSFYNNEFMGDTKLKEAFTNFTSERNPVIKHKIEELTNKSDYKGIFFVLFRAEKSNGNR